MAKPPCSACVVDFIQDMDKDKLFVWFVPHDVVEGYYGTRMPLTYGSIRYAAGARHPILGLQQLVDDMCAMFDLAIKQWPNTQTARTARKLRDATINRARSYAASCPELKSKPLVVPPTVGQMRAPPAASPPAAPIASPPSKRVKTMNRDEMVQTVLTKAKWFLIEHPRYAPNRDAKSDIREKVRLLRSEDIAKIMPILQPHLQASLLEGWDERKEPLRGMKRYVNRSTGEQRNERPVNIGEVELDVDKLPAKTFKELELYAAACLAEYKAAEIAAMRL